MRDLTVLNRPARTHSTELWCETHLTKSSCENSQYSQSSRDSTETFQRLCRDTTETLQRLYGDTSETLQRFYTGSTETPHRLCRDSIETPQKLHRDFAENPEILQYRGSRDSTETLWRHSLNLAMLSQRSY